MGSLSKHSPSLQYPLASDQNSLRVGATTETSTQGVTVADITRRYNSHDLEGTERSGPTVATVTRFTLTASRSSNIRAVGRLRLNSKRSDLPSSFVISTAYISRKLKRPWSPHVDRLDLLSAEPDRAIVATTTTILACGWLVDVLTIFKKLPPRTQASSL